MKDGIVIKGASRLDLVDWLLAIWRKRGLYDDRDGALAWLKTQDRERLERLKASGKPVYRQGD